MRNLIQLDRTENLFPVSVNATNSQDPTQY
jgi:hypothetical protein